MKYISKIILIISFIFLSCGEKPFDPINVKTEVYLEIGNVTSIVLVEGLVSLDEIYFNLFDPNTGAPLYYRPGQE